jgi:hypothetical protein
MEQKLFYETYETYNETISGLKYLALLIRAE